MKVYVECFHDMALVKALGISKDNSRHAGSKGNILNCLRKENIAVLGLIDADPSSARPPELLNYNRIKSEFNLNLYQNKNEKTKTIIEINPRLEEWLVERAKKNNFNLSGYGLPESAGELHRNPRYDKKPKFHMFLVDLLKNDEGMKKMKEWLSFKND